MDKRSALVAGLLLIGGRASAAEEVPWGVAAVGAPDVWGITKGVGVRVAILDSGIASNHPDLPTPFLAKSFVTGESVEDENGHGTMVAGIIAARHNTFGVAGVAPDVELLVGKVASKFGSFTMTDLIDGIDWAVQFGADVILIPGGTPSGTAALESTVADANRAGVLVIGGAGSLGTETPFYPAAYPEALAVAGVDRDRTRLDSAGYGSWLDLVAPGEMVRTTVLPGTRIESNVTLSGVTYAATPFEGSGAATKTAALVDCGLGTASSGCPYALNGAVALIERGETTFSDKVAYAASMGASAVIIYNNEPGPFWGTLGGATTRVVVGVTQAEGLWLRDREGQTVHVLTVEGGDYTRPTGSSYASAYAAGVAALAFGACEDRPSLADIRDAIIWGATDLGKIVPNILYGYGRVNAPKTFELLGCTGSSAELAMCVADLATANADLDACDIEADACAADLAAEQASMAACSDSLSTCGAEKTACAIDLSDTTAALSTCEDEVADVSGSLAVCELGLARSEDALTTAELKIGDLTSEKQALSDALSEVLPLIADADGDGAFDRSDVCPATPAATSVDASGCSEAQFCGGFDAAAPCRASDWRNDEPSAIQPMDCTWRVVPHVGGACVTAK